MLYVLDYANESSSTTNGSDGYHGATCSDPGRPAVTVVLTGRGLTLDEVVRVARLGEPVAIDDEALEHMRMCRDVVERVLAADNEVYGLTTGVGAQKSARVAAGRSDYFNRAMLAQCLVGQGEPVADDVVRATMLRLANGFARGVTGVRPELCELVVSALNDGRHPPIRTIGSIGQADLAPLAELAIGLLAGSGLALAAGEGLAMIDNNAFSTGMAAFAMHDCRVLLDTLDVAGALDLEAFGASLDILHPIAEERPFPGLLATLGRLRQLLSGSPLLKPGAARNLQDPLTFRSLASVFAT